MTFRLALRSFAAQPVRSLVLAGGFGVGIASMAGLLGVGEVILEKYPASSGIGQTMAAGEVSNPGSMACAFWRLRMKRPAPMSRRNEKATCVTTRLLRRLYRPALPGRLPASFRVGARSGRVACSAGANPNSTPATMETAAVNTRTDPSSSTTKLTGTGSGGWNDRRRSSVQRARRRPATLLLAIRSTRTPVAMSISRLRRTLATIGSGTGLRCCAAI